MANSANNNAFAQQAYYWQTTDNLTLLPRLRKEKEKELLKTNAGLRETQEEIAHATEKYKLLLALAMPCDDDLLGEYNVKK
jgi:hypothetical protein